MVGHIATPSGFAEEARTVGGRVTMRYCGTVCTMIVYRMKIKKCSTFGKGRKKIKLRYLSSNNSNDILKPTLLTICQQQCN